MLAVTPIAQAQDFFPPPADFLTPVIESNRFAPFYRQNVRQNSNSVPSSGNTRKQNLFSYTPTPALKQSVIQGYVDRLKTTNPAASQAISTYFGSNRYDYGQIYRGLIKETGLRDNDAADAMSAYLILNYMIVNNVQDDKAITPRMAQSVRSQVTSLLASRPQLIAPGVPAQFGEELKLQTVIVQAGWQSAIKENTLSNYRQGIAAALKNQYGLDLSQVRLTDRGFAKK